MRHFIVLIAVVLLMAVSDSNAPAEVSDAEGLVSTGPESHSSIQNPLLIEQGAESKAEKPIKPPLHAGRITGEILAGMVGLFVGVITGAVAGEVVDSEEASAVGGLIGWPIGNAVGVYIVGTRGDETGSFLATLGGSAVGLGIGALLVSGVMGDSGLPILVVAPAICATIGFNLTRRYKTPPANGTALLNLRDGRVSLGVPMIYSQLASTDERHLAKRGRGSRSNYHSGVSMRLPLLAGRF